MSDIKNSIPDKLDFTARMNATIDSFTKKEKLKFQRIIGLLRIAGKSLGEPYSKPLNQSKLRLYELKIEMGKPQKAEWRILYKFHPAGNAVLLHGGNKIKIGSAENWYAPNIALAEREYYKFLITDFPETKRDFFKDEKNTAIFKKEISDTGHKIGMLANQIKKDTEQVSERLEHLKKQEWAQKRIAHLKESKKLNQALGGLGL